MKQRENKGAACLFAFVTCMYECVSMRHTASTCVFLNPQVNAGRQISFENISKVKVEWKRVADILTERVRIHKGMQLSANLTKLLHE